MSIPFSIVEVGGAETVGVLLARERASWLPAAAAALRLPLLVAVWPDGYGFRLEAAGGDLGEAAVAAAVHAVFEAELVPPAPSLPVLTDAGWVEARRPARARTLVRGALAWPP